MTCIRCNNAPSEFGGYCATCDLRFGCTCCGGDTATCGCAFVQRSETAYYCTKHHRTVEDVSDEAPVTQTAPPAIQAENGE